MADAALERRFGIGRSERSPGDLELELRCLVRVFRAWRGELRTRFPLPWRRRVAALRHGFTSMAAVLYRIGETDPTQYVPDLAFAWRSYKINGFFNPIAGNKLVLSQILAGYGIAHPRVLALVERGRLLAVDDRLTDDRVEALRRLLAESEPLVFRPHWSGGGEGVFFLAGGGGEWTINGRPATEPDVLELVSGLDRYVVTAFVRQAAYAREIFPDTTNTIRVLTLWDEGRPFVAAAVHRFGTSRSYPLDNWHQGRGGLCAAIDVESATLGRSATLDARYRLEWRSRHPETGAAIEGVRIPRLHPALDEILRAARCLPGAPCIGWDAVITDDGVSILEANSTPGLYVWQVHAPLLADPRARRFFHEYGLAGAVRGHRAAEPSAQHPGPPA